MAAHLDSTPATGDAPAVSDRTCGICLEDSKDPLNLPCGHSFCGGCLGGWRSRYGVNEEMRRKCPTCRARIPPSKEMVTSLLTYRAAKQRYENNNDTDTSSEDYRVICGALAQIEEKIGAEWDGSTFLEDSNDKPAIVMSDYIGKAFKRGDIKFVLKWIYANRAEDRANAVTSHEKLAVPALTIACMHNQLILVTILLQFGANVDKRDTSGTTAIACALINTFFSAEDTNKLARLLMSCGATFFPDGYSREDCISYARKHGIEIVNLLKSELGGRRCEIVDLSARPELNGKTCVVDEYLPGSNQYKVTLETKGKEALVLDPDNLKRRDRTPRDCGYYIEFKNGRTIRHDFDSSEDCQAFVAALDGDQMQPVVTEEAEAAADQAAAELLAELGLDDSPIESSSGRKANKSKKKKGGKKKK